MLYQNLLLLLTPLTAFAEQCRCGEPNLDHVEITTEKLDVEHKRADLVAGINNASSTRYHELPFIAGVVYSSASHRMLCAAAILDAKHVLIAAHCVNGLRANNIAVFAGSNIYDPSKPKPKLHPVAAIYNHPEWDAERLLYDLAVVKLQDSFLFGSTVGPVCLWKQPKNLNNQPAVAVSWTVDDPIPALQVTKYEFHDFGANCTAMPTGGPQLCAYAPGTDVYNGGSDGPMLLWQGPVSMNYFVAGISTFGQGSVEFPEVATDVGNLTPWIQSVVATDGGQVCQRVGK